MKEGGPIKLPLVSGNLLDRETGLTDDDEKLPPVLSDCRSIMSEATELINGAWVDWRIIGLLVELRFTPTGGSHRNNPPSGIC